ncbi:MAG: hypothetical protein H7X92_02410 [Chitinophagales bacterium]|nr:hypothetical protein [Hyphomicrobiales bacterium]
MTASLIELSSLPALAISLAAAFIAYLQWRTASISANDTQYESRMEIYDTLVNFKKPIFQNLRPELTEFQTLHEARLKARIICNESIASEISHMIEMAAKLVALNGNLESETADKAEIREEIHRVVEWFEARSKIIENKFVQLMRPQF